MIRLGPKGPNIWREKSEGGDASRHGHLSIVDIKWVGFRIFRYILIDMFGPTGPDIWRLKVRGGGC